MYITMKTPDEVYINHFKIAKDVLKGIDFDQALNDSLEEQYSADLVYFIEESLTYAEKVKIKEEVEKEIKHLKENNKMY